MGPFVSSCWRVDIPSARGSPASRPSGVAGVILPNIMFVVMGYSPALNLPRGPVQEFTASANTSAAQAVHLSTSVSYTHLDVYKRQVPP